MNTTGLFGNLACMHDCNAFNVKTYLFTKSIMQIMFTDHVYWLTSLQGRDKHTYFRVREFTEA